MILALLLQIAMTGPITTSGPIPEISNCDGCGEVNTNWDTKEAIASNAGGLFDRNTVTLGNMYPDKCEYNGEYDPASGACVLKIRFAQMKHLVCTPLSDVTPAFDGEEIPENVTQEITCMYDPKQ